MAEKQPYHIFLSYSRNDSGVARKIADKLKTEGIHVWLDQFIDRGADWNKDIEKVLNGSSAVVFIVSNDSLSSPTALFELGLAEGRQKPVISVAVDDITPDVLATAPASIRRLVADATSSSPDEVVSRLNEVLKLQYS